MIALTSPPNSKRFALEGAVDARAAQELLARLWTDGAADGDATIVLDLGAVTQIDASALDTLFALKDLLGRRLQLDAADRRPRPVAARRRQPNTSTHASTRLVSPW